MNEYIQSLKESLPVFCAFICGALAQMIISLEIHFIFKIVVWLGLYSFALFLFDLYKDITKNEKGGIADGDTQ